MILIALVAIVILTVHMGIFFIFRRVLTSGDRQYLRNVALTTCVIIIITVFSAATFS